MIAVDTNVLVYAHRRESTRHRFATALVRDLAEGATAWAVPWACVFEFVSVVTNARLWGDAASTPAEAWRQVRAWAAAPTLRLLAETDGFLEVLAAFVEDPRVRGPLVHDARVAALCFAHGVEELVTADRDFALFPRLRTRNPFAS